MSSACFAAPACLSHARSGSAPPRSTHPQPSMTSGATRRAAPTRRAVLAGLAGLAVSAAGTSAPARAESMLEKNVRTNVTELLDCLRHAKEIRAGLLAGGTTPLTKEEAEPLARAVAVWLTPGVQALEHINTAPVEVGKGYGPLAAVLPIHLKELADERRAGNRKGCVRELDEYIETVNKALHKKGLKRFVETKRWDGTKWAVTKLD